MVAESDRAGLRMALSEASSAREQGQEASFVLRMRLGGLHRRLLKMEEDRDEGIAEEDEGEDEGMNGEAEEEEGSELVQV